MYIKIDKTLCHCDEGCKPYIMTWMDVCNTCNICKMNVHVDKYEEHKTSCLGKPVLASFIKRFKPEDK